MKNGIAFFLLLLVIKTWGQTGYFKQLDSLGGFEGAILHERFEKTDQFVKSNRKDTASAKCSSLDYYYEPNNTWWNNRADFHFFGRPWGDATAVCLTKTKKLKEIIFIFKDEYIEKYHFIRRILEDLFGKPLLDWHSEMANIPGRFWVGEKISMLYSIRWGYNDDHFSNEWSRQNCTFLTLAVFPTPSKKVIKDKCIFENLMHEHTEADSVCFPE